ncbi:(E)-4-hydroxy-3-methylbut-2-enyl-diphosphate synthase [Cerasicoccus arenae]|uniref:4-hydroxy-3-methylbut-2-en-1-yl diphosphate synthase (flavodoxin) n=2 Tax=Cerasicoccus arenae TaxID=424488 RepID=A0A8J3GE37_9BACT|nr:(E)-4-hydroxy-3-methylbut-2-enyl-diphosphate synthase [Cerasicoccus arenae]GHC00453.1 4-hydroxy-3-methylbut-2-en-1-yl diphosphate synthase (flavodoxin) [Cerasicoccus arenae]
MQPYCHSRFKAVRRVTREVMVGPVGVGGNNPIRTQSMTTSLTPDVEATVKQCIRLAEAGCEIVRITAPNKAAAEALGPIRKQFSAAGFANVPLVADIHFLPSAAMVAVEHVEKIRVNPGNYADKKKFAVLEYTDKAYEEEMERLHESFTPLVLRAKELGRALRIGTNHGSLSDRIMNRYGDTPMGMVESALEFIRIAESHNFHNIILSMKASNPKVMIQAYRMVVDKMNDEGMNYPLHLGVTEAGEGEDARIKSAVGIGALLYDGLGDTIRVSLTEDPWFEVPVCQELVKRAHAHWEQSATLPDTKRHEDHASFYEYKRREIIDLSFGEDAPLGPLQPPRVITTAGRPLSEHAQIIKDVLNVNRKFKDAKVEGLLIRVENDDDLPHLAQLQKVLSPTIEAIVVECSQNVSPQALEDFNWSDQLRWMFVCNFKEDCLKHAHEWAVKHNFLLALDTSAHQVLEWKDTIQELGDEHFVFTRTGVPEDTHPTGAYRALGDALKEIGSKSPLWIRVTPAMQVLEETGFGNQLIEASMVAGSLFVDGLGDLISIENVDQFDQRTALAYNLLQGARMRATKTEFVACPSCGRTLFDLQEVTQRIKSRTGHLKGVTIAVMGCIVNGPGEMADADFGYVGGAPNKINLYVGKECVKFNIPEAESLDRLVDLISEHGKWVEPEVIAETAEV